MSTHKVSDRMKRKQELAKRAQRFSEDYENHASNQRQLQRHAECPCCDTKLKRETEQ